MLLRIFTDGACSSNPGPGGWAAIINLKEETKILSGNKLDTTNNYMELMAAKEAVKYFIRKEDEHQCDNVRIMSDSAYVVNAINKGWLKKWSKNGWKTKDGNDIANKELWKELHNLLEKDKCGKIKFVKVKGHSGDTFNELADKVAKEEVEKIK